MSHPEPPTDPVGASLRGTHARFAVVAGGAARLASDVGPFLALPEQLDEAGWSDVRTLLDDHGPGAIALPHPLAPPPGIRVLRELPAFQMVAPDDLGRADPEARELGPDDVPAMVDLTARTEPGPFFERTIELGRYVGIHRDGALVAMAGERLRAPGWVEVSAVCTDPSARGQGLAERVVRSVAAGVVARGDRVLLHVVGTNTGAIRVYERLGFTVSRPMVFTVVGVG